MKRAIPLIVVIVAVAGGVLWMKKSAAPKPAGEAPADQKAGDDEPEGPQMSRDPDGNVVVSMTDEAQGDLGILVKKPAAVQMSPELKGYGRVLDPAPLAALMTELNAASAAATVSANDLARLKTLTGQGNASARALQAAEAAALRDQLAVQSAKDRLALSWGRAVADQKDLAAFIQSLTSLETELVRIDLPMGQTLNSPPGGARIVTASGQSYEAQFLGAAPAVNPQMQGQGFLFLIRPEASRLAIGQSVMGYLKVPGEPLAGVIIPREAVVRTSGAGWVYVVNTAGDAFTRTEIALDHPTEAGWFVTQHVTADNYLVVTAAQQLLSIELKGSE